MRYLYRDFSEQAQIDAQYNAGAAVPDYPRYLADWRAASRAVRADQPCELRVPYGPTRAETLDFFPAAQPDSPVLVFLHGGYWRALDAEDFSFVAGAARRRGFATAVVNYALCPWVTIDEIVRQARAAIAWVAGQAPRLGIDPRRIAVCGHSAGGHLTAAALFTHWARDYGLPQDVVRAAVPISGLFDLAPLRYSYLQPMLQLDEAVIARSSPIWHVQRVDAPVLALWGEQESSEFARQSTSFAEALAAAGGSVQARAVAGKHHFSVLDELLDAHSPTWDWISANSSVSLPAPGQ